MTGKNVAPRHRLPLRRYSGAAKGRQRPSRPACGLQSSRKLKPSVRFDVHLADVGLIGASPGKIGTALAQQNLRSVLSFCDAPQMTAPEAYIQVTPGLITDDGEVTEEAGHTDLHKWEPGWVPSA